MDLPYILTNTYAKDYIHRKDSLPSQTQEMQRFYSLKHSNPSYVASLSHLKSEEARQRFKASFLCVFMYAPCVRMAKGVGESRRKTRGSDSRMMWVVDRRSFRLLTLGFFVLVLS